VARYQKRAKIISYGNLVPYLNEDKIKILCDLKKSGRTPVSQSSYGETNYRSVFSESDAETYFEWLIATVTGSKEDASENLIKQANDQLFQFIDILGDKLFIERTVRLLDQYDWGWLFASFDKRLAEMRNIIDKGDKDITETLSNILMWMKKYDPILDTMDKEYKKMFGKVKK
jgi:hypothetical protein